MTNKKRVLTGITTSGTPHIGNLAGAILPAINASKDSSTNSFLFLADYHSLIKNNKPEITHSSSFEIASCWLACGLDPNEVVFYRQSDVPHIFELAWILSCLTSKGLMNRAHAYKAAVSENKSQKNKDLDKGISMGLFNYPVLMAADILMFNADIVPVGQDQKQHVEMTRDIALRFNHHYGEIFRIPEALIPKQAGILPGLDGRKMSKSYQNVIPIFLSSEELRKHVMKIKTDSKEPGEKKDSENSSIFNIFKAFASENETSSLLKLYEEGISWGDAKEMLFNLLDEKLTPYRENYVDLIEDMNEVEKVLSNGAEKALDTSSPLMHQIRKSLGIKKFSDLK